MHAEYEACGGAGWAYDVVAEEGYHMDVGCFSTFGIRLTGQDYDDTVHDVSVDRDVVARMAELFNALQLFPCHFRDVVADMIS